MMVIHVAHTWQLPMMTFHRTDFPVSGYLPVRVDGVEVLKVVPDASGYVSEEKEELSGFDGWVLSSWWQRWWV